MNALPRPTRHRAHEMIRRWARSLFVVYSATLTLCVILHSKPAQAGPNDTADAASTGQRESAEALEIHGARLGLPIQESASDIKDEWKETNGESFFAAFVVCWINKCNEDTLKHGFKFGEVGYRIHTLSSDDRLATIAFRGIFSSEDLDAIAVRLVSKHRAKPTQFSVTSKGEFSETRYTGQLIKVGDGTIAVYRSQDVITNMAVCLAYSGVLARHGVSSAGLCSSSPPGYFVVAQTDRLMRSALAAVKEARRVKKAEADQSRKNEAGNRANRF